MKLEAKGIREAIDFLEGLEKKQIKPVLRKAMRDGAKVIAAEARDNVAVDTGETEKGIKVRASKSKNRGDVSMAVISTAPIFAGGALEFGTHKMEAQPYLRPAFDNQHEKIVEAVAAKIIQEVEKRG